MTGEELNRKYWHLKTGRQYGHDGMHAGTGELHCPIHLHHHHDEFCEPPALHLDANLAIAEAEKVLLKFVIDRQLTQYRVGFVQARHEHVSTAPSVCEAVLKALISAKEQK